MHKSPSIAEVQRIMSGDTKNFCEEIYSYTPFLGNKKEIEQFRTHLSSVITTLIENLRHAFSRRQQRKLVEAIYFAAYHHKGHYRKDDVTPYIIHVLEVAEIIVEWEVRDYKIIIAAILHDTVEDTDATLKLIRKIFGAGIKHLVDLLSKDKKKKHLYYIRMKKEVDLNFKWRTIVIKTADRTHYFRTSLDLPKEERDKKVLETFEEFPSLLRELMETLKRLYDKKTIRTAKHRDLARTLQHKLLQEIERREVAR